MSGPVLQTSQLIQRRWAWLLALIAIEGVGAAIFLACLPSDAGGRFLGFSAARLLLLGLILVVALGFAYLAWWTGRGKGLSRWLDPHCHRGLWNGLFVLLPLMALTGALVPVLLMNMYRTGGDFRYFAYYQRLLPLFLWLAVSSLELFGGLVWMGVYHWQTLSDRTLRMRSVLHAGLLVWGCLGLVALFVFITGIGAKPDKVGWGSPTIGLLEWQIWLAWAVGILFLLYLTRHDSKAEGKNWSRDVLLAGMIWLLAAAVWLSQPIPPSYFATAGRAPNYEIYPFSDGAYYAHFAQSLLIGNGFKIDEIPARPFYVTLLAGFHALAGQPYQNVIFVQTLLLAFFPVVLFFLGRELHSRPAGLAAALLAILREWTNIKTAPFTDNASTSKLFFADLPTALVVSLWVLLVVLWLKKLGGSGSAWKLSMLVGGGLGLAMLFRTQSMFMLPAVLLLALLVIWQRRKGARPAFSPWLLTVGLVGLGLALTITPWLLRNWTVTGQMTFDDDISQTGSMAQRYSFSGYDEAFVYNEVEDVRAYSARVRQGIFQFLIAHPDVVAGFVGGHFLNAETANAFILPIRGGVTSPRELVFPTQAFWQQWKGSFTPAGALLFAVNLGLIAFGIGACWARLGWVSLIPLLINLSYNFSNALARNSGGRYLLVVDWVTYVYAVVALIEIGLAVLAVLGVPEGRLSALLAQRKETSAESANTDVSRSQQWLAGLALGLACLLVGATPALAEWLVPARYPAQTQAEMLSETLASPLLAQVGVDRAALEHFARQPGAMVVKGRALYPRYYAANQGEPRTAKTGYQPLLYPRTVFLITGNTLNRLAILRAQAIPTPFPNASDIIAVGCIHKDYLDTRLLLVSGQSGGIYQADEGIPERCTLEETKSTK